MVDLKRMQEEMDNMEKSLEEPSAGEEELHTDAPGTDPPGTQAPGTQAPGTTAPGTEPPSTDAPSTDAPVEDPRDVELRKLREEMEELKKHKSSTKAPSTSAPATEAPIGEEDFIGDLDLDDLSRDKGLFNKVLNKVYVKGMEVGRSYTKTTGEQIIRHIPDIAKNTIAMQAQLADVKKNFYDDNKDLVPWAKSVATVFEEMIASNPDKHYSELITGLAKEVRNRIGLQKDAGKKPGGKDDPPPKLPKGKGGKRQSNQPDLDGIEKEMDDMDKALGLD